jgi:flagellar motility protein MotE (MotC chaperone)
MDKFLDEQEQESKKYNRIQWFFVVIVIPTIFALVVAVIVVSFAGVDVWGKAKEISGNIPFLSDNEEKSNQDVLKEMENRVIELQTEIEVREETITVLESEMDGKEQEIQSLQLEKEQLQMQLEELNKPQENGLQTFKEIISTFENMSAKKAAPIISLMNENEALNILSNLKPETLASFLENMDPEKAAKYTTLLTNNSSTNLNE